jgi:hypothetical protein
VSASGTLVTSAAARLPADQGRRRERVYDVHGLRLSVFAPASLAPVLAAIDSRLKPFAAPPGVAPDLRLAFHLVANRHAHLFDRPAGGRPVYDPVAGEASYCPASDQLFISAAGDTVRALCHPARACVVSASPAAAGEVWLLSHPIVTLPLYEAAKRRGRFHLHAACVALGDRGLLIAGASGAGKSTLALALARAGFAFLGDDTVFLAPAPAAAPGASSDLRVLAFPDEVDIADQTAALLPELRPLLGRPKARGAPKRQFRVEDVYAAALAVECRPAAVVFPRVAGGAASRLAPMRPDDALLELAPNVLLVEPRSSQAHLDILAALVRQTPCYRLETGTDLDALPAYLRPLVE